MKKCCPVKGTSEHLCCLINPIIKCRRCSRSVCEDHGKDSPASNGRVWKRISNYWRRQPKPVGRSFAFGSMSGKNMRGYRPRATSLPAQLLKVAYTLGRVPRCFFYDSAVFSNLAQNKGNLLRYVRRIKGYKLTATGRKYVKDNYTSIKVGSVLAWIKDNSVSRYINDKKYSEAVKTADDVYLLERYLRQGFQNERRNRSGG